VLALTASALGLGLAGSANALTTVDLEGTVTNAGGVGIQNVSVVVFDAADLPFSGPSLGSASTDANGHYTFEGLDFDGPVRILFEDDNTFTQTTSTYYVSRWNGGSRFWQGATPVPLTTDGDSTVNISLPRAAILAGSVTAADGQALDSWDWELKDTDDNWAPTLASSSDASNFRIATEPGTVRFGAIGWGRGPDATWSTPDDLAYIESWWKAADRLADATPIQAIAGQVTGGLNLRLTNQLTARQAPKVIGIPAIGRPLTATPGTWTRNAGTEFTYSWMRGATVVGTGATYTPTVADFGQRLSVVVRALNGSNAGQAASAQTDVVRWPADAKGKAKALDGRKVRFGVKIVSAKQSPVKGKVVVMRGAKKVHKAVKLVKGKAVIVVKGQPKGKQTYTVLYKGNSLLSIATKTFTVRVHR
jgi:hypothetical protein